MRKSSEVFVNGKCLQDILEAHKRWLNNDDQGIKADLYGADLNNADLSGVDLRYADLSNADLRYANLRNADLRNANLSNADLMGANLSGASLRYANLSEADLTGTNLRRADLSDANLSQIIYDYNTMFFAIQCPEEGSFIGYKNCNGFIVKLEIPSDAKRSSATSRKCRCSKAKVLSITNLDGSDSNILAVASNFDPNFIYTVGEIVEEKDFDENRWCECSNGIHYFITRNEAVSY